jgi:hypothetical protein
VGGRVLDIGAGHRSDVVVAVRLLLGVLRHAAPDVDVRLRILNDDDPFWGIEYRGGVDAFLAEFENTEMLGFAIMMINVGFIRVTAQSLHHRKLPYLTIVADYSQIVDGSYYQWDESILDEIIKYHGIYYAVLSADDTLDLHELDHVDEDNFPWKHWNLVAARTQDPSNRR